jgi:hypothetical protein
LRIADLSPAWLTRALAVRTPGVEGTAVAVEETLWGTATKALLSLEYNAAGKAAGLPAALCVKGGFADHRELMKDIYATETVAPWYQQDPSLDIERIAQQYARLFYAGIQPKETTA